MYPGTWYRVPSSITHHHTFNAFKTHVSYINSDWTYTGIRASCIPWMVNAWIWCGNLSHTMLVSQLRNSST